MSHNFEVFFNLKIHPSQTELKFSSRLLFVCIHVINFHLLYNKDDFFRLINYISFICFSIHDIKFDPLVRL